MIDEQALLLKGIDPSSLDFEITKMKGGPMPMFMTFDKSAAEFTIKTSDSAFVGNYAFQIKITSNVHPGWACKIDNWLVTIALDAKPISLIPVENKLYLKPYPSDQYVRVGQAWEYSVPVP